MTRAEDFTRRMRRTLEKLPRLRGTLQAMTATPMADVMRLLDDPASLSDFCDRAGLRAHVAAGEWLVDGLYNLDREFGSAPPELLTLYLKVVAMNLKRTGEAVEAIVDALEGGRLH